MCHLQRSGFVLPAAGQQYSQDLCPSAPTVRVLGLQQPDGVLEMVNCRSESWAEGGATDFGRFHGSDPRPGDLQHAAWHSLLSWLLVLYFYHLYRIFSIRFGCWHAAAAQASG